MGRKCVAGNCKTGYASQKNELKISVFKFPSDPAAQQLWINALPNILTAPVTKHVGVCALHWPDGYATVTAPGGKQRPRDPPSVFNMPLSFHRQMTPALKRDVQRRAVDGKSRAEKRQQILSEKDKIQDWENLKEYCNQLNNIVVSKSDTTLELIKLDGYPPQVLFSVFIDKNYKVTAFKKHIEIPLRDVIPSFSHQLERYSELDTILTKVSEHKISVSNLLEKCSGEIVEKVQHEAVSSSQKNQLDFLSRQLLLLRSNPTGRLYCAQTLYDALNLFLRNKNCYRQLQKLLALPDSTTLRQYFGKLSLPESENECKRMISSVFTKLKGFQKYCTIVLDEMYIKPTIRNTCRQIIGYSIDDPEKPPTMVLAILIAPMMGAPAFVARLFPLSSLSGEFLLEQVSIIIKWIHDSSGSVFLAMNGNLRINQNIFKLMREKHGAVTEYSINHPIPNPVFPHLFLLYDPTRLFKNVCNNWVTEKAKSLSFRDPTTRQNVIAKWTDLTQLYNYLYESGLNITKLNYQTLYPDSFAKQKVSLLGDVFNEKTVTALNMQGYNDTATFVNRITRMWNILNVKSPVEGIRLNNPDRNPISDENDSRFQFLIEMADSFSEMDPPKLANNMREQMLTIDASEALALTLRGIVALAKLLLQRGFTYVMLGQIQSDRIEGEFGIYRPKAGGNNYISIDQVLNGLRLQKLKLFKELDFESSNHHMEDVCCSEPFSENELICLDECFENVSELTDVERGTVTYIAGYITQNVCSKNKECPPTIDAEYANDCEFLDLVKRGKLSLPLESIYELSLFSYSYYKMIENKRCPKRIIKAFQQIYEVIGFDIENHNSILSRLVNCFSKAHSQKKCNAITRHEAAEAEESIVKKSRLSF